MLSLGIRALCLCILLVGFMLCCNRCPSMLQAYSRVVLVCVMSKVSIPDTVASPNSDPVVSISDVVAKQQNTAKQPCLYDTTQFLVLGFHHMEYLLWHQEYSP